MTGRLLAAVLALMVSWIGAEPAAAQRMIEVKRDARSGFPIDLLVQRRYNFRTCAVRAAPKPTVMTEPANGKLVITNRLDKKPAPPKDTPDCPNFPPEEWARFFTYTSNPGFKGTDTVVLRYENFGGMMIPGLIQTFTITVK